ncbi:A/G-specific adenine glycosylase [Dietzia sp.]|uniref:A/G-specific adenine glycosylase n=1 Tax=Dietzia sp. TaxID=1871616 RepID=UPI002FDA08B5
MTTEATITHARADTAIDAEAVIDWFDEHGRTLPWRAEGSSAWSILLCEVMSQQTPVDRVIPAWHDWIARWPGPAELAEASPAEVLRAWGKLGYPRRALRLLDCARVITERHGGVVPGEVDELLALPGVGDYTARAVAAFHYGSPVPVVDTNIRRVIARADHGVAEAPPASKRELREMEELLPGEARRAVRFCAAVMELGALVCRARGPRCDECPIAGRCAWRAQGYPAFEGKRRAPQKFAGTDRQVRGLLLDVLRDGHADSGLAEDEQLWVPRARLDAVWPDAEQRYRALRSLLAEGLLVESEGSFALPH